jgi:UDP:flavonoid glycosyltransferase YjiC (YdhE family)
MFNKMSLPRKLIKQIYTWLIESFNNNPEYIFIVVNAGNIELPQTGSNFFVYDSFVPQTEILKHADLFITHAGAHSLNESLHAQVPMIAIPFFWDQHLAAKNIDELGIGKAFLHEPENQETAMFLKNQLVERPSLTKQKLSETIIELVHNAELYKKNIEIIIQKQPDQLANIIKQVKDTV